MLLTRRIAPVLASAAICVAASGAPALGAGMTHWSKSQCSSWAKGYTHRHSHPSKSEKAKANKVLKAHGCSNKIK
jgi:hypothetical protein